MKPSERVIANLAKSHSQYHAVALMMAAFEGKGYQKLEESEPWILVLGGKYFVTRNGTSIIGFAIPESPIQGFQIVSTHNDSPSFKVKPSAFLPGPYGTRLNVEPYGGMIMYSWLDRPLSFAGRVVVEGKKGPEEKLFDLEEDALVIPSLAIHQNRDINSGHAFNAAVDTIPLISLDKKEGAFNDFLSEKLGTGEKVLAHDLFLYIREEPRIVGLDKDLLLCPRLDDLSSAYSSLEAILSIEKKEGKIPVFASFDNEEVGSMSRQGAMSDFLVATLSRILLALGKDEAQRYEAFASSTILSVDNGHANHPNFPAVADPTTSVKLNGGVVIKYNAGGHYTTDAQTSAYVKMLAAKLKQPIQEFTNRSDLRGGSTLGNISNTQVSIATADIGLPQLAMHSSVELCGIEDINRMVALLKEHYLG